MRFKKTLLNYVGTMLPSLLIAVLTMTRTSIFIEQLGWGAKGIEGVFYNIFSFIHLAEAGLGIAVITTLYKLVAQNDHEAINRVLTGARHQMKRIGMLIFLMGAIITLIVPSFFKGSEYADIYIYVLWFLYLFRSVIGYLIYAPSPLVSAHQNDYKLQFMVYMPIQVVTAVIEIILLLSGFDLIALVIFGIVMSFVQQITLRIIIKKQYAWFNWTSKEEMDLSTKEKTKDIFVHKVATMVLYNTDSLVISSFVGVTTAGLYAVYKQLMDLIGRYVSPIFSTAESSLGNLYHSETKERKLEVMNEQLDVSLFISALVLIPTFLLGISFIMLWIPGDVGNQQLSSITLLLFVIMSFYSFTRVAVNSALDLHALFKLTKLCAIIEAVVNLVLSLVLVQFMGINGVLLGTIISLLVTNFWYYPYILYREVFEMKPWRYYRKYIGYCLLFVVVGLAWQFVLLPYVFPFLDQSTWIGWIISGFVIGGVNAAILILIFWNSSKGFRHFAGRFLGLFREIKERRFSNSK